MPVLGTKLPGLDKIDENTSLSKNAFEESAKQLQKEREDEGLHDVCEFLQLTTMPVVNGDLVGIRLDICCTYFCQMVGKYYGGVKVKYSQCRMWQT